jgi:oligogalacturonide lyase
MVSRRTFLRSQAASGLYALSVAGVAPLRAAEPDKNLFPSVAGRYFDPATEFPVFRLTDPKFESRLPTTGRFLMPRALLYATDASGSWQARRLDLKTFESRQLTEAAALDPDSLAFLSEKGALSDKGFWHFDSGKLIETIGNKSREAYRMPDGFEKAGPVAFSDDGLTVALVEKNTADAKLRLRIVQTMKGTASTLIEGPQAITDLQFRPKHNELLYRTGNDLWTIRFDGSGSKKLALAEGETRQAQWAADGHALTYLNRPGDTTKLANLREFTPDASSDNKGDAKGEGKGQDVAIANTTQYVRFHANSDASVFVGAGGSKASPYVFLLSRAARRELTLAEHRASDASMVNPVFSPNSQFLLFISDRHGKPAVYRMSVERFVSETGS